MILDVNYDLLNSFKTTNEFTECIPDKELIILLLNNDHEIIYKSGFIQNLL